MQLRREQTCAGRAGAQRPGVQVDKDRAWPGWGWGEPRGAGFCPYFGGGANRTRWRIWPEEPEGWSRQACWQSGLGRVPQAGGRQGLRKERTGPMGQVNVLVETAEETPFLPDALGGVPCRVTFLLQASVSPFSGRVCPGQQPEGPMCLPSLWLLFSQANRVSTRRESRLQGALWSAHQVPGGCWGAQGRPQRTKRTAPCPHGLCGPVTFCSPPNPRPAQCFLRAGPPCETKGKTLEKMFFFESKELGRFSFQGVEDQDHKYPSSLELSEHFKHLACPPHPKAQGRQERSEEDLGSLF